MFKFDYVRNLIVPTVSEKSGLVPFEVDLLVLTKSGYATGVEIKVSKSDLKADFKKRQHKNRKRFEQDNDIYEKEIKMYFRKFKYFYYAVPAQLQEIALEVIPEFCGLYIAEAVEGNAFVRTTKVREAKELFKYKWNDRDRYDIARLGSMKIYNYKYSLNQIKYEIKNTERSKMLAQSSKIPEIRYKLKVLRGKDSERKAAYELWKNDKKIAKGTADEYNLYSLYMERYSPSIEFVDKF